jgi:hypothetical protein
LYPERMTRAKFAPRLLLGSGMLHKTIANNSINFFFTTAMADSSINEPFILATYNSILRGNRTSEIIRRTYASVSKRSTKSHEYVTIAAQADGIHILDVSFNPVLLSFYVQWISFALRWLISTLRSLTHLDHLLFLLVNL